MPNRRGLVAAVIGMSVILFSALPLLAGSISMGPQAMEGDLKVSPGTVLMAGYDFTIPGSHPANTVQFVKASVTFQAQCVSGTGGGTIVVFLSGDSITVPQNSSGWFPSGDQSSPLVYQGSVAVPDLCKGGLVRLQNGGTFSADLQASDTTQSVHVRWHYSANGSSGSWSGTASFRPGPLQGGS
ncbi:MAG TPA: hypothetical protein VN461_08590 [Vicinamibacteria bacterium]|jgi:hypothetical protein|nr:hypothetical protein [Vicinamibacteria bacterium]